ncbi:unnamed protein product [Closterium sp. NIES-65]|nr:unnamed protein product [Closterium sp. NIES-65]
MAFPPRAYDDRCTRSDGSCPCGSQPRRGPGEPGPSPAPSRLGAGWARSFLVDITRAAPEVAPFGGLGVSPSAWTCSCLLEATAAAGIPTFAAVVVAPSAVGASPRTPVAADTAAASTAGVTGAVSPPAPPPPQAVVPGQPPTLVEQRVMHVGTCLTLLSYVLDQLHVTLVQQEVQIGAMQPAAVAAAEELQHYLPLIGFVPGSPGAALGPGPGALARLAESAREDPLDLVAAAASVLRWLDGRLCWILVE